MFVVILKSLVSTVWNCNSMIVLQTVVNTVNELKPRQTVIFCFVGLWEIIAAKPFPVCVINLVCFSDTSVLADMAGILSFLPFNCCCFFILCRSEIIFLPTYGTSLCHCCVVCSWVDKHTHSSVAFPCSHMCIPPCDSMVSFPFLVLSSRTPPTACCCLCGKKLA